MTAIKLEEEIELRIWLPWFMLIYTFHFYNPIIPKVALTEHNIVVSVLKHFTVGQKRALYQPPPPFFLLYMHFMNFWNHIISKFQVQSK